MNHRVGGVLLHPTSLPGPHGIGDFGPQAHRFVRWASAAGLGLWQLLPLSPPGPGNSPYSARSAFAGSPLLISPERLVTDGLLDPREVERPGNPVDWPSAWKWKEPRLRAAWQRFLTAPPAHLQQKFERFADQASAGLKDWLLYTSLARRFAGRSWIDWPAPLRDREPSALNAAREELADEIAFEHFLQFLFFDHWQALRQAAGEAEIQFVGDLPIYVAFDSADVWAHRELFELDAEGHPTAIAGVPPDYFNAEGQLWGNPLYRWDVMAQDGFAWWIERVRCALRLTDWLRLDHFRGFEGYWRVPLGDDKVRAGDGSWVPGPGKALFDALRQALGPLPLFAEDLGELTDAVHALRAAAGLPGMKVLQFGFAEDDSEHRPDRYSPDTIAYTGTHDNDTLRGWFEKASQEEQRRARELTGDDPSSVEWGLIRALYASAAERVFVPMQDFLGLGSEARMNTPGTPEGNWQWRFAEKALTPELADRLRQLADDSGRLATTKEERR